MFRGDFERAQHEEVARVVFANPISSSSQILKTELESAYVEAHKGKNGSAMYQVGKAFLFGQDGAPIDPTQGLFWLRESYTRGVLDAGATLALVDLGGLAGVPQDREWGRRQMFGLAEKGSVEAIFHCGNIYMESELGQVDVHKAVACFEKSAAGGHVHSLTCLGLIYLHGLQGTVEETKGLELLNDAADRGDLEASKFLFERCRNDRAKSGQNKTWEYGQRVARLGYPDAMRWLASVYADPKSPNHNLSLAAAWLEKDGKAGNSVSAWNAAELYRDGLLPGGVNYQKSLQLFQLCSELGNPAGDWGLGRMHYSGQGCNKSIELALRYFLKGVVKEDVECVYGAGLCFRDLGMYQDAAEQFSDAARDNHLAAKAQLVYIYKSTNFLADDIREKTAANVLQKMASPTAEMLINFVQCIEDGFGFEKDQALAKRIRMESLLPVWTRKSHLKARVKI